MEVESFKISVGFVPVTVDADNNTTLNVQALYGDRFIFRYYFADES